MEEPPEKKQKTLYSNTCIVCFGLLKKQQKSKPFVNNPKYEGLKVILDAANERKDELHDYFSPHREDILTKVVFVTYHVSCRASYTSKTNIKQPDTAVHSAREPPKQARTMLFLEMYLE